MADWSPAANEWDGAKSSPGTVPTQVPSARATFKNTSDQMWELPAEKSTGPVPSAPAKVSTSAKDYWMETVFRESKQEPKMAENVEKPQESDEWEANKFEERKEFKGQVETKSNGNQSLNPPSKKVETPADDWESNTFRQIKASAPAPVPRKGKTIRDYEVTERRVPPLPKPPAIDTWGQSQLSQRKPSVPVGNQSIRQRPDTNLNKDWGQSGFQEFGQPTRPAKPQMIGRGRDEWEESRFDEVQSTQNSRRSEVWKPEYPSGKIGQAAYGTARPLEEDWGNSVFPGPSQTMKAGPAARFQQNRDWSAVTIQSQMRNQPVSVGDDWGEGMFKDSGNGGRNPGRSTQETRRNATGSHSRGFPHNEFGDIVYPSLRPGAYPAPSYTSQERNCFQPDYRQSQKQGNDRDMSQRYGLPTFTRGGQNYDPMRRQPDNRPRGYQNYSQGAYGRPSFTTEQRASNPQPVTTPQYRPQFYENEHCESGFHTDPIPLDQEHLLVDSHFRAEGTWESLGLPSELLTLVKNRNFLFPSKVQAHGIKLLLANMSEHVLVQAPTGSGKTLTYVLSALSLIDKSDPLAQVICIAHTGELLQQITEEFEAFAQPLGITVNHVHRDNRNIMSQVLVMTPAQCFFCFCRAKPQLEHVKYFILDEADHLLNKDDQERFHHFISAIVKNQLPPACQVLLFSATYSDQALNYIEDILDKGYLEITVKKEDLVLENIKSHYIKRTSRESKLDILMKILKKEVSGVTLVFVNTIKFAQVLSGILNRRGCKCALLIGHRMTIEERSLTFDDFKRGFYNVLVATNVLARGIDNTHIARVVNFDIPVHYSSNLVDAETYLHRIGRSGRFNRPGQAITLVSNESELKMLEDVMLHYGCVIDPLSIESI